MPAQPGSNAARPQTHERTLTPQSVSGVAPSPSTRQDKQQPAPPPTASSSAKSGTIFAAAVLAGSLTPTPKTLDQLYLRIGTSEIPPEATSRLRDLSV
ncbi:hypothetical protein PSQ90_14155 [Devosia rhodophyticola]|uniref:Uncharacterized protein n=1 Tax=Devosia rhodophyticola TaxID=3026423 RepID=A0ABY7YVT0_9HYPH|nr:hypothetical protein [Devosia rhodophyticola]WDR05414.1 hypothetical protein PSQ90_14155 [Devosia rhodophyticola]